MLPRMASPTSPPPPPKFKVRFKRWTAVAVWKWITPNDETECGICRLPFEGCCPDCKFPGDDCALGGCGLRVWFPHLPGMKTRTWSGSFCLACTHTHIHTHTYTHTHTHSVRSVSSQLPPTLHSEVARSSADAAAMPHVQTRLAVQWLAHHHITPHRITHTRHP